MKNMKQPFIILLILPFFAFSQANKKLPLHRMSYSSTILDGNKDVCKKYFEADKSNGKAKDSIIGHTRNLILQDGYSEADFYGDLLKFQPEFQKRLKIPADVKAGENRIRIWVGFAGNYEKIEKLKVSDDRVADQMVSLVKSQEIIKVMPFAKCQRPVREQILISVFTENN